MTPPPATVITLLCLAASSLCFAQTRPANELELRALVRHDRYPQFLSYVWDGWGSRVSLNLEGNSWGMDGFYKAAVSKWGFFKAGLGYYQYNFNDIQSYRAATWRGVSRRINITDPPPITIETDRYYYHTITPSLGYEHRLALGRGWHGVAAADLRSYYTFAQHYHLTSINPDNSITGPYKRGDTHFFGLSAALCAGVQKRLLKRWLVGPSLVLPVWDRWRKDGVFPEESDDASRSKTFKGWGVAFSLCYSLQHKTTRQVR